MRTPRFSFGLLILLALAALVGCDAKPPTAPDAVVTTTDVRKAAPTAATLKQTWQVYVPDGAGFWQFADRSTDVYVAYEDPATGQYVTIEREGITNKGTALFDIPASVTYVEVFAENEGLGFCPYWPGAGYTYKNGTLTDDPGGETILYDDPVTGNRVSGEKAIVFNLYGVAHQGSDIFYLYMLPCAQQ